MSALSVFLGEIEVGILEHFEDESERFTFHDRYLSAFLEQRPILGQLFEDRFPNPISVGGPIGWFAHLLPQGVMRKWRSRLYDLDEDDSFRLLAQLGDSLPGAVILRPTTPILGKNPGPSTSQTTSPTQAQFRFSLAGAQWKMSARTAGRGLTTNANARGVEYIAKFHSPEFPDLPECEFATMYWAKESGIQTPEFEMRTIQDFDDVPEDMPTGKGSVYVCRRFDRDGDRRIHMEDFGQILDRPPGNEQYQGSYEEIANILRWIAPDSVDEFIRVLVFCIYCGNVDAHLKNFSILYDRGRVGRLTPAYDLVAAFLYYSRGTAKLALKLGGDHRIDTIALNRFAPLFQGIGWEYSRGKRFIDETAERIMTAWRLPAVRSNYSEKQRERLDQHVATVELSRHNRQ